MKYVVFSFDDGSKDFYSRAFKILKKYNLPAVLNIISDFAKTNKLWHVSWEEIIECARWGIEIANHSAKHTNELEDIMRGVKDIQEHLGTTEKIGFASPYSEICEKNFAIYNDLLVSGHTAYIRSGNQLARDGFFNAFLYLTYKYTASREMFFWYNRRNIIMLDKEPLHFLPSVTCNRDNTVEQILYLIEKMPDDSACILMFHRILEKGDDGYKKSKWSTAIEDFECLCNYLSKNEKVSVISNKMLCEVINNSQHYQAKK